jgi:hypothetical protein
VEARLADSPTPGVALLFSIAAFGPSMAGSGTRLGLTTLLLAVHGVVFTALLLLFIAQSILVRKQNVALHGVLGFWSAILAATLVIAGYQVTIAMGRRGYDLSGDLASRSDPIAAMAFPLLDISMFAALFLAAYLYRRRPAIHKRLMLLAVTGALMPAPIAHLVGHFAFLRDHPISTPLLVGAFLFASAIHDRIRLNRIHPVSLWIALAVFLLDNVCAAVIMPSAAWHSIGRALTR